MAALQAKWALGAGGPLPTIVIVVSNYCSRWFWWWAVVTRNLDGTDGSETIGMVPCGGTDLLRPSGGRRHRAKRVHLLDLSAHSRGFERP